MRMIYERRAEDPKKGMTLAELLDYTTEIRSVEPQNDTVTVHARVGFKGQLQSLKVEIG